MARMEDFFRVLHEHKGSDLHLSAGCVPMIRLRGELVRIKHPELSHEELVALLYEIAPDAKIKVYEETGDVDFAYEVPHLARYRANYFRQARGAGAVFREIPQEIMTMEQLDLPERLNALALLPKGLVLVTGPTGSGKSTTLAAILDYANKNRRDHILTIEDPIEFVHTSQNCLVNQRQVGRDSRSFATALRGALREDPDIILVGEMRDLETISLALEAALTGHLVFATLHTVSAPKTMDRIIEVFPPEQQAQIRTSLSESLQAVLAQVLLRRRDKPGRVAAQEIMMGTVAVRNMIRENKTFQLPGILQTGHAHGMKTLDDDLFRLVNDGIVKADVAAVHMMDKKRLSEHTERVYTPAPSRRAQGLDACHVTTVHKKACGLQLDMPDPEEELD